ncbi:hypothetical protein AgCh_022809 [Apium graveolens]
MTPIVPDGQQVTKEFNEGKWWSWIPGPPDNMSLLEWNFLRVANPQTVRLLLDFNQQYRPCLIFLSETPVKSNTVAKVSKKLGFAGYFAIDVQGYSGGIALMWKNEGTLQIKGSCNNFIDFEEILMILLRWKKSEGDIDNKKNDQSPNTPEEDRMAVCDQLPVRQKIEGGWISKEAEAIAMKDALTWIIALQYEKCVLETDSKMLGLTCNGSIDASFFGTLVDDCVYLSKHINHVLVQFEYKSANKVTHELARTTYSMSDIGEWYTIPPNFISHVLDLVI